MKHNCVTLIHKCNQNGSLIMVQEMTCYDLYNPQSLGSIFALHGTFIQPSYLITCVSCFQYLCKWKHRQPALAITLASKICVCFM